MHRLKNFLGAAALAGAVMACGLGQAPGSTSSELATAVAGTLQALTPSAPPLAATSAIPQSQGILVEYQNVSFTIPAGLAAGATSQTVPAATEDSGGPWGAGPEHIRFELQGYNVPAHSFWVNRIEIWPAQEYANQNPGAQRGLARLRTLLADPAAELTNESLPNVPDFNASSVIAAQAKRVHFVGGEGVRSITQYAQAVGPIANNGTFYHFEGLTSDGKYYIIAVLPVHAPFLENPDSPNPALPAGGIPFPGMENMGQQKVYDDYFKAVTDKLNATAPDEFTPSLAGLDALVQSISVK